MTPMTPFHEVVRLLTEPQYANWRDPNLGRDRVTALEHALQCATRAERAGATEAEIVMALVHDAARPLSDEFHGQVIAWVMDGYLAPECVGALSVHGGAQAVLIRGGSLDDSHFHFSPTARRLAGWDAASFATDYDSLPLAHFLPMLARVMRTPLEEAA